MFSNLLLSVGDSIKMVIINKRLNSSIIGIVGNIIFLLFIFFSLISFDIAIGNPNWHKVINRLNVGNIREYIPIPLVFIILVRLIFIIIPSILDMKPPIINIIVDFINLFFIIYIMIIVFNLEIYC